MLLLLLDVVTSLRAVTERTLECKTHSFERHRALKAHLGAVTRAVSGRLTARFIGFSQHADHTSSHLEVLHPSS